MSSDASRRPLRCGGVKGLVALGAIARMARLQGVVPVEVAVETAVIRAAGGDRSLLLIDRTGEGRGWRRLLDAAGSRGRSHLLLIVTNRPAPRVHSLRLEA